MRYNKILEVSEDNERVYFSFYLDNINKRIIGIPKFNCINKEIYSGTAFTSLSIVDSNKAKLLLTELMKRTMRAHPATQLCDKETLLLID
jgi:hypothetical protein